MIETGTRVETEFGPGEVICEEYAGELEVRRFGVRLDSNEKLDKGRRKMFPTNVMYFWRTDFKVIK